MSNTAILDAVRASIKQNSLEDAIADLDWLEGQEVRQLAKNAKAALETGNKSLALSFIDRCYGR